MKPSRQGRVFFGAYVAAIVDPEDGIERISRLGAYRVVPVVRIVLRWFALRTRSPRVKRGRVGKAASFARGRERQVVRGAVYGAREARHRSPLLHLRGTSRVVSSVRL